MTSTPQTKAGKMEEKSTLSVLKTIEGINVSHLTTVVPQVISITTPPLSTVIRVKLGGTAHLPCRCGRFNVGSSSPPKWENSRGEDVLLTKPEADIVPRDQRKYLLYNDLRWLKVRDDCSLALRKVTWEDQGEYTCTFLEPEFEFVPYQNYWKAGQITRKVTLMLKDLSPSGVFMVTRRVQEQPTTVTTPRVNSTQMKLVTLASETTKTVHTSTQATTLAMTSKGINATTGTTSTTLVKTTKTSNMTSLTFKDVVNVTQKLMLKIEPSVNNSNEIAED